MELSKSDKKVARAVIEKGLQQEFSNGLNMFRDILDHWKKCNTNNRETYLAFYERVRDFDKHIALRYNDMRGADYLFIIAAQLNEGFINEEDLASLSTEAQTALKTIMGLYQEFNK